MASIEEILVDLEATVGYVRGEITQQADQVGFEEAVALTERLERVKREVGDAISLLTTRQLTLLEKGSKQIGTRIYASVPKTTRRTDHAYVTKLVVDHAVAAATDHETGEVNPRQAADAAVLDMQKLFVPPSRNATVGGLKRVGAKIGKAFSDEDQGRKIQIVDLAAPQSEEDDDDGG